ncbi:MAG: sigma-70 family RNA polymerase sigma factor [bacterium]|nr:sigma-70 family RNA polymerase sigma factor [bacterium]
MGQGALGAQVATLDDSDVHPLLAAYLERRQDLVRYFRVRLRSEEAAEDLVQDIYLKVAARPAEPVDNPTAYLYRLGTNLMLDRIKAQRRAVKRETEWRGASVDLIQGQDASAEPAADDALAARQRLAQIIETVNELPPAVREAFRLHKLEGLNHAETAAAMGVSRSSVEKYIMTSLKRILAKVGR